MRFKDKVAIITGAASGIGLLTAQRFAEEGARALLIDVNRDAVAAEGNDPRMKQQIKEPS